MIAVEIVRSIRKSRIHGEVTAIVIESVRVSVVPEELEALAKALLNLHLQRVVVGTGIVAEVVADVGGTARQLIRNRKPGKAAFLLRDGAVRIDESWNTVQEESATVRGCHKRFKTSGKIGRASCRE